MITSATERRLAERFADRTNVFGTSIWIELANQKGKHADPVYFGDGSPDPSMLPIERLRWANQLAWDDGLAALTYGDQRGYGPLLDLIAQRVSRRGIQAGQENIVVTGGSTQGLDYACRVFLQEGDAVIVEAPTFLGAIEIFETYGVDIIGVPSGEHGMDIDLLEVALRANPHAKVVYTIPTFQNPSGTLMPLASRERMIELAREYNVAIFEDDPYGELQYSGEAIPPIRALDDQVVYFGTFSKTIAPGIRTGYVISSPEVSTMLLSTREVADISNDRIMMRTVYHAAHDFLDAHVEKASALYASRRDAMLEALEQEMPEGVTWSKPDGGFFVWITLPENVDNDRFFSVAGEHGVIFFPGGWFDPNREITHTIRLSFSTVPEDRIRVGIARLGQALRDYLAEIG